MKKDVLFSVYGEELGKFPVEVCTKCGEELFDEATSQKMDEVAKKKGVWGLGAPAKVTQVGSSLAVVINKRIATFLQLQKGKEVYVHPEDKNKLIIDTS